MNRTKYWICFAVGLGLQVVCLSYPKYCGAVCFFGACLITNGSAILLALTHNEIKVEPLDYKDAVHYRPMRNNKNVRCLNGSAHIKITHNINEVTCEYCLNPNTNKDFWNKKLFKSF